MNHRERPTPLGFDEQRALENLQNLHRDIQRARAERERAEAEFDVFLEGCRKGDPAPDAKDVGRPPQAVPSAAAAAQPAAEPAPPEGLPDPDPDPVVAPPMAARVEPPRPLVAPARRRQLGSRVAIPIAVLALIAAIVAVRARREEPGVGPAAAPPAAVAPGANDALAESSAAATAAEAAAPAVPEPGLSLEIVTVRPVWVRVLVDGRRAIERELAAGQRIPLRADRSIVIRAGDAGALTVRRGSGQEVSLGADGVVATREFSID